MMWSDEQISHWRRMYAEYAADSSLVALRDTIRQQRQSVQEEMLQVVNAFLAGELTLKSFNAIFQQKTHGSWNIFHVRGASGGMFLNKLAKYLPDGDHQNQLLRVVFRLPKDIKEGHWWMQAFARFLEGVIASGQATRLQLQPARIPFFLSIWWHLQAPEQWPIAYPTLCDLLLSQDKDSENLQDPVERYFVFRMRFVSLTHTLGLTAWETEHLLTWYSQKYLHTREREQSDPAPISREHKKRIFKQVEHENIALVQAEETILASKRSTGAYRSQLQWLLAKLGRKVGYQVWIRAADQQGVWHNECLGTLSSPSLPVLADPALQQIIEQTDVLWFLNNEIVAAYHIEQAQTDIALGLLRLLDIGTLAATEHMHLCLVVPQECFEKVHSELQRPIFRQQDLQSRCALISQEVLLHHAEHILRWARSLFVISDLTALSCHENDEEPSLADQRRGA